MFSLEQIRDIIQNKNFIMFTASLVFMSGILASFYGHAIFYATVFTLLMTILLCIRVCSIRKVLIFASIFYIGFFMTFVRTKNYDELLVMAPVDAIIQGRIVSIPDTVKSSKAKFFVEVSKTNDRNIKAKTFVTVTGDDKVISNLNIGDLIEAKGKVRKPFQSTNPSQFDFSRYLQNFNTFTTFYVKTDDVKILQDNLSFKWKFLQSLNNKRNEILKVHSKYLKSPNLEILGGIVFGDDAVTPPDYIKNSFINSGLLHILAASGMNVAFIYTFLFYILKFLKVPFKICVISGMLVVVLYTLMTGLGASVVRASLMLLFVLAGKLIDRDANSVALLSFVAVLMLIYNPAYINDVGFQLSFLVTFGLITTSNILAEKIVAVPNYIKITILIPIVAQIWVAPVQMFYFNTFSLYSIMANIISEVIVSVISFGGFVSSILSVYTPIADLTCKIFDFVLNYFISAIVIVSDYFANMKYSLIQTTHPSIIQLIIYYIMLISATYLIKYDKYKQAFITVLTISILLLITTYKPISKDLEIITFNVQNADAFLIKTPENKYFMIDTGKAPYDSGNSQAKIIILKYLKDRGIKNLEGVIVTHFDNDHSGGTVDIISNENVKTLYLNPLGANTVTASKIRKVVNENNQKVVIIKNNTEVYNEKDLSIKLFIADIKGKDASNGSSIITLLSFKDFEMLFMGDAGVESFNIIKKNIPHNVEVLKVGHHGGPNVVDENMINHLGTKVSVISTGVNYFGHPNKGTLDILRNTIILRTDFINSIKISTDGKFYKLYSYDTHDKNYILKEKLETK